MQRGLLIMTSRSKSCQGFLSMLCGNNVAHDAADLKRTVCLERAEANGLSDVEAGDDTRRGRGSGARTRGLSGGCSCIR